MKASGIVQIILLTMTYYRFMQLSAFDAELLRYILFVSSLVCYETSK
jgi:hypothetical protein